MPVIGLCLAIVPILAILAVRGLAKLILLPVRGVFALLRTRPARAALLIAVCVSPLLAWTIGSGA